MDYKNYGIEVKAGENSGITASDLLIDGKLDFLYYLKGIFSIFKGRYVWRESQGGQNTDSADLSDWQN